MPYFVTQAMFEDVSAGKIKIVKKMPNLTPCSLPVFQPFLPSSRGVLFGKAAPAQKKTAADAPLYKPMKSSNPRKKGMVYVMKNNKKTLIHFGDANMQDFTQHHDQGRKRNYCARSGGITNKSGTSTANDRNSANYWARKVLWGC